MLETYDHFYHPCGFGKQIVREAEPFVRASTNMLLTMSAYQILLTFLTAFALTTGTFAGGTEAQMTMIG